MRRKRPTKYEKRMQKLKIGSILLGLILSFFVVCFSVFVIQNYLLGLVGLAIFTVTIRALFNPKTLGKKAIN